MAENLQSAVVDAGNVAATAPAGGASVEVTIRPHAAKVRVQRLSGHDPVSPSPPTAADWTLRPNHTSGTDPIHFWLGPAEQLIESVSMSSTKLLETIRLRANSNVEFMTDVSSALAVLRVRGPGAAAVLATDCTLDLESADLAPGRCAQTLFAQTSVLIHPLENSAGWDLYVESPAVRFVHDWLLRGVTRVNARCAE